MIKCQPLVYIMRMYTCNNTITKNIILYTSCLIIVDADSAVRSLQLEYEYIHKNEANGIHILLSYLYLYTRIYTCDIIIIGIYIYMWSMK